MKTKKTAWFYSDKVKSHFFKPKNFIKTKEEIRKFNADGVGMVGSPACLIPSTLVYTDNALKPINIIINGEKVLGHDSKYHSVKKIFRTLYPPIKLKKIRNYLGELVATSDHLVFAKQIPTTLTFHHQAYKKRIPSLWVHAGELKRGDVCVYPLPLTVKPVKSLSLISKRVKFDFKSIALPKSVKVTKDLLELFGYFIAEGYTRNQEVGFVFSDKELHLAKRVRDITKKIFSLESQIRTRPKNHRIDVNIYNVHLARIFRELFGGSAETKRIPEFIMLLDSKLQKGLLKGLWLGDGYFATWRSQPRAGYVTVSPTCFKQIITLLLRQRIIPSTFIEKAKKIRGVNHRKSYRIHVGDMGSLERLSKITGVLFKRDLLKRHAINVWFEDNYICLPIKKVERISYSGGRLLNFEVAESHTYATDAFLVHNCGDMMKMWIKVDKKKESIKDVKWQTFGCASAIATTSVLSEMAKGMKLEDARKITPKEIVDKLAGIPAVKYHCSVLGDKALREAINDYFRKTGQYDRVVTDSPIIDNKLKITERDIENSVIEGAKTLKEVQQKTKVGIENKNIRQRVEELIKEYRKKHGV